MDGLKSVEKKVESKGFKVCDRKRLSSTHFGQLGVKVVKENKGVERPYFNGLNLEGANALGQKNDEW